MNNWIDATLGDVLQFQRGFDITKKEQESGNVPVVSSSGITSFHNQVKVNGPGVVIGRKGTLGTVHYVNSNYWPHDTTLWVKDFKGNFPKFIYYFLKVMHLEKYDTGASNPTLNRNHIHKIKLKFPPLNIQRKIAAVLSTYDDLIENNDRCIDLLEKMAEEIYREWFVRMRFPGHEQANFHKGIPQGWKIKSIENLCSKVTDGAHTSPDYFYGGMYMASVKDMESNGFALDSMKTISEANFRKLEKADCKPLKNDVLIAKDGSYLKHVFVWDHDLEVVLLSSIAILRPNLNKILPYFFALTLKQDSTKSMMSAYVSGSALPRIILNDFKKMNLLIPPLQMLEKFESVVSPIYRNIKIYNSRNLILKQTRDRFLTRLVSGKLSVEYLDIQFPPSMTDLQ